MKDWDESYRKIGEIQTRVSDIVRTSIKLLKKRNVKKILDLGFGTGRHTIFLAESGFTVYGIDISQKAKQLVERKAKEKSLKNVYLRLGDMHEIPFKNNFFDAITAIYTIEHNTLTGLRRTISELSRVLKPKGILVATLISSKDPRYGTGKMVEANTFTDIKDPAETNVPHHFSDNTEVKALFSKFKLIGAEEKKGFSERRQMSTVHWEIIAEKL